MNQNKLKDNPTVRIPKGNKMIIDEFREILDISMIDSYTLELALQTLSSIRFISRKNIKELEDADIPPV